VIHREDHVQRLFVSLVAIVVLAGTNARGQTLTVQDGRFALDGRPQFLVFVSFFDGVRRIPDSLDSTAVLDRDLDFLYSAGVRGLRVFPNWHHPGETLMDAAGRLRPLQLKKLQRLIAQAAARRMAVDLSFTLDTISGLTADAYKRGLQSVARQLKGRTNVFFDLQNELDKHLPPRDSQHPKGWTLAEWRAFLSGVRAAVKAEDPDRLITASWTSDRPPADVTEYLTSEGYDILAYHYRRPSWVSDTSSYARTFASAFRAGTAARPIYFQEPARRGLEGVSVGESDFVAAVLGAKNAGAAAWTLHMPPPDLSTTTPFRDLLGHDERAFLGRLRQVLSNPY
jgi:hypothetical protein